MVANGQWFNQPCLWNETYKKPLNNRIWELLGWWTHWGTGRVVPGRSACTCPYASLPSDCQHCILYCKLVNVSCWEKYQQPQICRWYHPKGRKWRGTKEPLDEDERGEWNSWLKTWLSKNEDHGIQFLYFMASRWGNNGNSEKLFFLGSKIIADGDCSHEIKRCLLLVRKAMINLDIILKSRDITLLTRVHLVKAMVFPVVMYGCESWTIKKAEHQRIDAFEQWFWKRHLRVLDCEEIKPVNPKGKQS